MNSEPRTNNYYDVAVIGAGHAGCEAANASAKLGAKTLLLTSSLDTIGWLACSPSFGGPGRGHLMRELDAMGGLMPSIIDKSAIHFRHSGKDKASWAPFAICDRHHYHRSLKSVLEKIKNLSIKQDIATGVLPQKKKWRVLTGTGQKYTTKSVVIAAGTFLKGRSYQGQSIQKAGRNNELAADELAKSLQNLGFKLGIFRTGTGPTVKLDKNDLKIIQKQAFDKSPRYFSFETEKLATKQVPTYKTFTNNEVHKAAKRYLKQRKTGKGPRYCPSLLDKISLFPEKGSHPVFLQPESLMQNQWFLNGLSMDFVDQGQQLIVNLIEGLKNAKIVKNGYSVSYYYLKSGQLDFKLESRKQAGLFFAGQATGSNGYEEAAAAGLVAGLNAALAAQNEKPAIFMRQDSFIGVLVDDLASKKITEPYRMLWSRAGNNINLRSDNADVRLAFLAYDLGLTDKKQRAAADKKKNAGSFSETGGQAISLDNMAIPRTLDFATIGLSSQAAEKLKRFRPLTVGEALKLDIPEKSLKALALYLERLSLEK